MAAWAVSGPAEAGRWCRVSRGVADACRCFGIWGQAVRSVRWPPSDRKAEARALVAYGRLGAHCRSLFVDGLRCGPEEILCLARLCPQLRFVEVTGIGALGVDREVWRIWGKTLRCANLSFFYDAVDGAPALRETLGDVIGNCEQLEHLAVAGMDWLTAGISCLAALGGRPTATASPGAGLRRLELTGSEDLADDEAVAMLRRRRPGLEVRVAVRPLPNLDW